jgi:hypothetical protein
MKKLLVLLIFTFSLSSHAFLLEPYVGYGVSLESELTGSSNVTADTSSTNMGARLGFNLIPLVDIGVDYKRSSSTWEPNTGDQSFNGTDIGIFAAYSFPILIRAYYSYFLNSEIAGQGATYKGTGFVLGAGYTGLPLVSINLEMHNFKYDEGFTTAGDELKTTGYVLSVSLPISL